jgi:hypothetical protein
MPGVNLEVMKITQEIGLDVLSLKKDEDLEIQLKDEKIVLRRIQ